MRSYIAIAEREEAGLPSFDLNDFDNPLVLLIPSPEMAKAAA